MITLLFIALAAACNAVMDTLTHHFHSSIFRNMNQAFWNPSESWKGNKFLGWVRLDAWHLLKFAMIFSLAAAVGSWWALLVWGMVFELLYSKLLK